MHSTREYLPRIYANIPDFDALVIADDDILSDSDEALKNFINNQYVKTAGEDGISQSERDLKIVPDKTTEDLEFRRERVLNRKSLTPPFTEEYLREKLDTIIGVSQYTLTIDSANYTIYVESSAANQRWFNEIMITVSDVKPCNMVFINKPLVASSFNMNETVSFGTAINNYRLGVSWILGAKPFSSFEERGVIKLSTVSSVQAQLIADVATFTASDVASVLINDSLVIDTFSVKAAVDGVVDIEYTVAQGSVPQITSIKLRKADDTVLLSSAVYVPVIQDVVLKHLIKVQEGI